MESTRGNTHSVTFFPPGNVFFGSMISTMHPLTTNTAAVPFPVRTALKPARAPSSNECPWGDSLQALGRFAPGGWSDSLQ